MKAGTYLSFALKIFHIGNKWKRGNVRNVALKLCFQSAGLCADVESTNSADCHHAEFLEVPL